MATEQQIDAGMTALRTARMRLYEASQRRNLAVLKRVRLDVSIGELNADIVTARASVLSARNALQLLLAEPLPDEPVPETP